MNKLPRVITAGITFDARLKFASFPATAWQAVLIIRGATSVDLNATDDGDAFSFHADADVTKGWKPGECWYSVRVSRDSEVREAQQDNLVIEPDLATAPDDYDGRSYAEKTLDAIEAVIANRATIDQMSYAIKDRQLSRTPIADLLALRDQFRNEVRQERARKNGKNPFGRRILMVMK